MNLCAYTIFHSDVEFWCLPLIYEDISQVITIIGSNGLFSNFSLLSAKNIDYVVQRIRNTLKNDGKTDSL